jgi:curved DNA-binding protein CbpA
MATLAGQRWEGCGLPDKSQGDAYSILGVTPGSTDQTIAAAYRALARQHHPDIAGEQGTARMIRVNAAFAQVRTASLRAAYDRERTAHGFRPRRWSRENDGTGGAGPPPGRPTGSVLDFGRHKGWSIGEIARVDPGYLLWLEERREGRQFVEEIDRTLRAGGFRRVTDPPVEPEPRRRGRAGRR